MLRLYYDDRHVVRVASTAPILTNLYDFVEVDPKLYQNVVGKKIRFGRSPDRLRLAVICNWGDACGIATYSRFLLESMRPKLAALKIFAEDTPGEKDASDFDVEYCWVRGKSMAAAIKKVLAWRPDVVLIQHEYGIFPKATFSLQMLQMLAEVPYAVTMHSVYEHLDKTVCSSPMKAVIVHSGQGEACLRRLGHKSIDIAVIPHGCVQFDNVAEHFNITYSDHAIIQFGFGFRYKGVDTALKAVAELKSKWPDIHYLYLCTQSPHVSNVIDEYYVYLRGLIEKLGLIDNAVIIRGFQTEEILNNYLRTYKMAIFPYKTDPKNTVYGASGAIRIAMANGIPTVASDSHMFDDLDGVLPRPNEKTYADAIGRLFSDQNQRNFVVESALKYVAANTWDVTADRYLAFLGSRLDASYQDAIFIP